MISREQKRGSSLHEKFQLLRTITNSHAENETSTIVDASKYIQELKHKVENINEDIIMAEQSSSEQTGPFPMVAVETLEKGFFINVFSGKNQQGLLVSVLEAFEDLGLNVLEARVSCTDTFSLQAIGEENDDQDHMDAEGVKRVVTAAIKNSNWSTVQRTE
ncbi:PREDICTED: uncharacterized protein LOC104810137 isoform X2 [Tarenaya hassleriana]|uniref:uncharacterized protein LOC104810137 isoform X2 n=1 Tax=Tarenaya hassleriana TaxID=28532 RepID=UPI00053C3CE2|nr:PREDICTED: uncharacterized protein LOC104810137 isoform X2 [Tarenaya hassleriana]